ncbi:serine hydrolase FSH [Clohesyomyces aquaticus]|uniref:Serine hydrolase FSH n=1 Tax=Clohesyomyces aquaticus TaxID=1231657 RepID=A0A1Y1Y9A4_9PLEO|nr:serine hydrolase FSH [Clohesyomyces aquaticus]
MRFLCFHGMGTNGKIFEIQTSRLRNTLGNEHEYVFLDGSIPAVAAPGIEELGVPDNEFLRFTSDNDLQSTQTLYSDLLALIESEAPFDGIMGFSEGAGVALSLLAMHAQLLETQKPSPFNFKCGIFFCGAPAFDAVSLGAGILRKLDPASGDRPVTLPTAHIWSRDDELHPGFGEASRAICAGPNVEEYVHDLGHTVPGARSGAGVVEASRAVRRTIERAREASI